MTRDFFSLGEVVALLLIEVCLGSLRMSKSKPLAKFIKSPKLSFVSSASNSLFCPLSISPTNTIVRLFVRLRVFVSKKQKFVYRIALQNKFNLLSLS